MTNPVILTVDDINRLFGAVAAVMDTNPGMRFDPETQRVLATVRSLVVSTPTGPADWSARVLPYVIQNPLPDMPEPRLSVGPDRESAR
ncbi:hypothetical protein [Kribbella sp. CA-247076]|uniref:hypothetical protein n=1 Tax=Kribbella sp. CA-247076 TaxID=3239941 RepID=UPI003D8F0F2B